MHNLQEWLEENNEDDLSWEIGLLIFIIILVLLKVLF